MSRYTYERILEDLLYSVGQLQSDERVREVCQGDAGAMKELRQISDDLYGLVESAGNAPD